MVFGEEWVGGHQFPKKLIAMCDLESRSLGIIIACRSSLRAVFSLKGESGSTLIYDAEKESPEVYWSSYYCEYYKWNRALYRRHEYEGCGVCAWMGGEGKGNSVSLAF